MFHVPEGNRLTEGHFATSINDDNNGAFIIHQLKSRCYYQCIASDGMGWEHVYVTIRFRNSATNYALPSWNDMCFIKSLFWDKEDVVIQYHPRESEYVNNHNHVLHLWRPIGVELPSPPSIMVGIK